MKELNEKITLIENEMDIRVESMIIELQNYRDALRLELVNVKESFNK